MSKSSQIVKTDAQITNNDTVVKLNQIALTKEHRCNKCNKLLGIENLYLPTFDIKCNRCGHLNSVLKDYSRQVIITDKNGHILYINPEVERATGYSAKEIIGQTPAIWGNQMTPEFYNEMWYQIKDEKRAYVVKVTNRRKDGTLYDVILRISPILDDKGEVEFFIGMETAVDKPVISE